MISKKLAIICALALLILVPGSFSKDRPTNPKEHLGFDIGADYMLVNYTQLLEYWKKLDAESDRLALQTIGTTAGGRTMVMAVGPSPAHQKKLARYRDISRRLALAEGLSESQARALATEGRPVVLIDGGLQAD